MIVDFAGVESETGENKLASIRICNRTFQLETMIVFMKWKRHFVAIRKEEKSSLVLDDQSTEGATFSSIEESFSYLKGTDKNR